jgi:phosphoserine phosphatase
VAFCVKPAVRAQASHIVDVPDFRGLIALLPAHARR